MTDPIDLKTLREAPLADAEKRDPFLHYRAHTETPTRVTLKRAAHPRLLTIVSVHHGAIFVAGAGTDLYLHPVNGPAAGEEPSLRVLVRDKLALPLSDLHEMAERSSGRKLRDFCGAAMAPGIEALRNELRPTIELADHPNRHTVARYDRLGDFARKLKGGDYDFDEDTAMEAAEEAQSCGVEHLYEEAWAYDTRFVHTVLALRAAVRAFEWNRQ